MSNHHLHPALLAHSRMGSDDDLMQGSPQNTYFDFHTGMTFNQNVDAGFSESDINMWSSHQQTLRLGVTNIPSFRIDDNYAAAPMSQQMVQPPSMSTALAESGLPSIQAQYNPNSSWTATLLSIAPQTYLYNWTDFWASVPATPYSLSPNCSSSSMISSPSSAMSICALSNYDGQSIGSPYIKIEHPGNEGSRPATAASSCQQSPLASLQDLSEGTLMPTEQQFHHCQDRPSVTDTSDDDDDKRMYKPPNDIPMESTLSFNLVYSSQERTASLSPSAVPTPRRRSRATRRRTTRENARAMCNICEKYFSRPHNLTKHMITHIPNRKKPHGCTWPGCAAEFERLTDVRRHLNQTHLQLKPFECEMCGNLFPRKDTLMRHERDGCRGRGTIRKSRSNKCQTARRACCTSE